MAFKKLVLNAQSMYCCSEKAYLTAVKNNVFHSTAYSPMYNLFLILSNMIRNSLLLSISYDLVSKDAVLSKPIPDCSLFHRDELNWNVPAPLPTSL